MRYIADTSDCFQQPVLLRFLRLSTDPSLVHTQFVDDTNWWQASRPELVLQYHHCRDGNFWFKSFNLMSSSGIRSVRVRRYPLRWFLLCATVYEIVNQLWGLSTGAKKLFALGNDCQNVLSCELHLLWARGCPVDKVDRYPRRSILVMRNENYSDFIYVSLLLGDSFIVLHYLAQRAVPASMRSRKII